MSGITVWSATGACHQVRIEHGTISTDRAGIYFDQGQDANIVDDVTLNGQSEVGIADVRPQVASTFTNIHCNVEPGVVCFPRSAGSCGKSLGRYRTAEPASARARLSRYNDATACGWNAAYQASQSGDVAIVKGGSYGDVRITPNKPSVTSFTFKPASGETVTVGEMNDGDYHFDPARGGNNITFLGPVTAREFRADHTVGVTVDGWNVTGNGAQITQPFHVGESGTSNFTLRNSKVHGYMNPNAMVVLNGTNFVIDHNDIYDDLNNTNGAIHDECFRTQPVSNMTLTRNHFWSCNVMDVFLTGSDLATNWLVENNVFEAPTGSSANAANGFAFRCGSSPAPVPDGFVMRYNTFGSTGVQLCGNATSKGFTVMANYFDTNAPSCSAPTVCSFNINGSAAARAGFMAYLPYQGNGGSTPQISGDYRLRLNSPLIDQGGPVYPALDFGGVMRYLGLAADVGAYEAG